MAATTLCARQARPKSAESSPAWPNIDSIFKLFLQIAHLDPDLTRFVLRNPVVTAAESQMINLAAQSNVNISTLSARGLYTTSQTAGNDFSSKYAFVDLSWTESLLSDLPDGTSSTFIHNSNDLEAGIKSLAKTPETVLPTSEGLFLKLSCLCHLDPSCVPQSLD